MSSPTNKQLRYVQVPSHLMDVMESLTPSSSEKDEKSKLVNIQSSVGDLDERIDAATRLIWFITFVGDSSRGILYPVLFKLVTRLGGSTIDLGYIVAMFSVGRLVSSTPLGYLCDLQRHRLPLLIANITLIVGAIIWSNALLTNYLPSLYLAQFMLGLGSGTLGLTRSYVVERVHPKKRTEMISLLTSLQYAGFTVSPILGAGVAWAGSTNSEYLMYALPAYLIAIFGGICVFGLFTFFENIPMQTEQSSVEAMPWNNVSNRSLNELEQTAIDRKNKVNMNILIVSMIFLNFTTKGSIAVYETLGSAILIDDYNFTIFLVGVLVSAGGAIGTAQLLLFKRFWSKRFSDLQLMLGGIIVMIVAQLSLLSYGAIPEVHRFIIGFLMMYGVGYPIGHTAVIAAFSKIQRSGPQAALLSWFATAGSVARVVIPISSDYIDIALDNGPFCIILLAMALSYTMIIILKPLICYYTASDEVHEAPPGICETRNADDWIQFVMMTGLSSFAIYALVVLVPGPG